MTISKLQIIPLTRDFLLLIYALYYAQDSLYSSGSIISKACLMLIILISGVFFVKTMINRDKKSTFYNGWSLLVILNIAGFIFTADLSDSLQIDMFKNILGCMLPFYPFYFFASQDKLKADHLVRFLIIMMPVTILQFFNVQRFVLSELDPEITNVVNNVAYSFVNLIPFIFLIKKNKLISIGLATIMIFFIIQGAKRGAIIAGSIGLLMYFYYQMKTIEKRNLIRGYLLLVIGIIVLSTLAYKAFMTNEFIIGRMTSILEGNTSDRDIIYQSIFNNWFKGESVWSFLFGFGFAGSLKLAGDYAHNDWLELLSNFGLFGISVYLYLFWAAAKQLLNNNWLKDKWILMFTITLIWFFVTLVSMGYTNMRSGTQAILFAYLVGSNNNSLK